MKLTSRTILLTGGSAGIGLAFALKFLEIGNQVIVTGGRQSVLDEGRRNARSSTPSGSMSQVQLASSCFVLTFSR
jgi:short-subunit dehydrogenase involved in D-alanine esterification of teichoic acids